ADRTLRLFACGCVRLITPRLDPAEHDLLVLCESFADGLVPVDAVEKARQQFAPDTLGSHLGAVTVSPMPWLPLQIETVVCAASRPARPSRAPIPAPIDDTQQVELLAHLFPTVERPQFDLDCLTWSDGLVVKMARTIYDEHRFSELPVLADALEEAGCA